MRWAGWPLVWPLVLSLRMPSIYGGSAFGPVWHPQHRAMRRHSLAFACVPALPVLPVLPCSQTLSTDGAWHLLYHVAAGTPGYVSKPPHPAWKPGDKQPIPYAHPVLPSVRA